MAKVKVLDMSGAEAGTIDLKDEIFGIEPNQNAVHGEILDKGLQSPIKEEKDNHKDGKKDGRGRRRDGDRRNRRDGDRRGGRGRRDNNHNELPKAVNPRKRNTPKPDPKAEAEAKAKAEEAAKAAAEEAAKTAQESAPVNETNEEKAPETEA